MALVTGVVLNVDTFESPDTVVGKNFPYTPEKEKSPEVIMTGDNSGDNTVVNSQSDELWGVVCGVHGVWTDVLTSGESFVLMLLCSY
ncbi:hypothetical protein L195_g053222 [Trifolium pratense]|uniref:Uncharacterized protein n=1 Tax=Trifolium pratense TaxID=57577 RepID=A0A2K3K9D4_TRIPR|nr:hypothetical protein L195_g053222 [Trifolium pratense]